MAVKTENETSPARFIMPFIRSIQEVLATMAGTTVTIGKPGLKVDPAPMHDVSGVIGFSGQFVGSMVLTFDMNTAKAVVKAFAGAEMGPESPDFADAIGELANMIAGSAKKSFESNTSISVPSVIIGKGHTIARLQGMPCLMIPCTTAFGDFAVEVSIKNSDQTTRSNG